MYLAKTLDTIHVIKVKLHPLMKTEHEEDCLVGLQMVVDISPARFFFQFC